MTHLNVAIFTDNDFDKVNGVTTTLRAVLKHTPADIRTRVYTCAPERAEQPDYFALKAVGIGIPFYDEMRMYFPPFRRLLREAVSDRIGLIHYTTPGPMGLAAMWVASRLRIPMVGSFHTHLAEYTRMLSGSDRLGNLMREYMRWPYGRCMQVLAPSEATRRLLIDSRIDPTKLRIWTRGVDTDRFSPEKRSERLRRRWGVSDQRPAILYAGRISREKGLEAIKPIQRALRRAALDHRFVFVGQGPMQQELRELCPDAVFTGTLDPDGVAAAMASADMFVFPSRTDTAGNVVLEAQASGLPVLVTGDGGPRENMEPDGSGVVCERTSDFSARLIELILDREWRARLSHGARAYALGRRWSEALEPLYRAYREVAAAPRGALSPQEPAMAVQRAGELRIG